MLMARDPRVIVHVKKLTDTKRFGRHFPDYSEFWSTRANRELRVIMTPTVKGWKVLGLARKGGSLYANER